MALTIKVAWDKAIMLGAKAKFQKNLAKMIGQLPEATGIYVFARRFGKAFIPMYIGQASNGFRKRLNQQANNLKLMEALREEKNGDRVLLLGRIKTSQGQRLPNILDVAEQAHIEHALTEGHQLINIKGTKTKRHQICITGTKSQAHPFPRTMYLALKKSS